LFIQNKSLVK